MSEYLIGLADEADDKYPAKTDLEQAWQDAILAAVDGDRECSPIAAKLWAVVDGLSLALYYRNEAEGVDTFEMFNKVENLKGVYCND